MNPALIKHITEILIHKEITTERKVILQPLIDYIQSKVDQKKSVNINFICTHNSRRSHLSQIWAQTAAYFYKVSNINCYSGGTESTALFPTVVETLVNQGLEIHKITDRHNPIYVIKYDKNEMPIIGFSKKYDMVLNPVSSFIAVMTCSQADDDCPFVVGAEQRVAIKYEDPKTADKTANQNQIYKQRSEEIGSEMFYIFSQIRK